MSALRLPKIGFVFLKIVTQCEAPKHTKILRETPKGTKILRSVPKRPLERRTCFEGGTSMVLSVVELRLVQKVFGLNADLSRNIGILFLSVQKKKLQNSFYGLVSVIRHRSSHESKSPIIFFSINKKKKVAKKVFWTRLGHSSSPFARIKITLKTFFFKYVDKKKKPADGKCLTPTCLIHLIRVFFKIIF